MLYQIPCTVCNRLMIRFSWVDDFYDPVHAHWLLVLALPPICLHCINQIEILYDAKVTSLTLMVCSRNSPKMIDKSTCAVS